MGSNSTANNSQPFQPTLVVVALLNTSKRRLWTLPTPSSLTKSSLTVSIKDLTDIEHESPPSPTSDRHIGHVEWHWNHSSIHEIWNKWEQYGRNLSCSSSSNSTKQTAHSVFFMMLDSFLALGSNRTMGRDFTVMESKPWLWNCRDGSSGLASFSRCRPIGFLELEKPRNICLRMVK